MADSKNSHDWLDLTKLTNNEDIVVERVKLREKQIAIEGAFELPPLARLTAEDQVFVVAFLRSHGSIKEMEQVFGISYPTVKSRLNKIAEKLEFVEMNARPSSTEILEQLGRGDIDVTEALKALGESSAEKK